MHGYREAYIVHGVVVSPDDSEACWYVDASVSASGRRRDIWGTVEARASALVPFASEADLSAVVAERAAIAASMVSTWSWSS